MAGAHLLFSAAVAAAFAWRFGKASHLVVSHVLLLAEWDLALLALTGALIVCSMRLQRVAGSLFRVGLTITVAAQLYLYALNAVSNASWGRNINAHLVAAFAPTIWSGREPFPVGPPGITALALGIILFAGLTVWRATHPIDQSFAAWFGDSKPAGWGSRSVMLTTAALVLVATGGTLRAGVASRDDLFWKEEPIASFFRPVGFAFEPTERRAAAAARDEVVRASYPHHGAGARRKNVVLVIVDSLRADRMQVYGYSRPTTPFLSELLQAGVLKKVSAAFSTCSESLCGITSTLASREFPEISARTYDLQDVLRDEGYQTWFLLSGNHIAWNGLPQFYRAPEGTLFDGSQTVRYSMDDDRLILEGLERVPAASPGSPAFFYVHLMSTHYLGVQFENSHVFTRADDRVSPGPEPYKILEQLNDPDRYDDKVRQADGIIRELFNGLAAKHYLDDAMVVITGDHGEGLGERHWAHGWDLHNEDIQIPLLIYDQPAASYPDLTFGAQVDIAPTILDRLGLPIPESWDGESLLAPSATRFTYHQTYFIPNRFAVLYRDHDRLFKFIATPQYGQEELFDLRRDPGEVRNLAAEDTELAALLRDKVRRYLAQ